MPVDLIDAIRIYDAARSVKAEAEATMETVKDSLVLGIDAVYGAIEAEGKLAFDLVVTSPGNVIQVAELQKLVTRIKACLAPLGKDKVVDEALSSLTAAIEKLSIPPSTSSPTERWRVAIQDNHYTKLSKEALLANGVTVAQIEASTVTSTSSFPTIKKVKP